MRIIDLLNKKANGEGTPKKFKYDNLTFEENEYGRYIDEDGDNLTKSICYDYSNLNDEIEIIEEDKKIYPVMFMGESENEKLCMLKDKINEIIEVLNEKL